MNLCLPASAVLWIAALASTAHPAQEEKISPRPYGDLEKMGAGFEGPGREETAEVPAEGVKVGLTCPEKTHEGQEFRIAAEIAFEERNAKGGYRGKPFVAVFRADDGPWGMASKQVVALAFDERVWAILGGFDGTRAHLAELIAAKAWVPVVTPVASDLSIDFGNVPWMFRVMPSDGAQAQALFSFAARRGLKKVAASIEGERDSIIAGKRVQEAGRKQGISLIAEIQIDPVDPEACAGRLKGVEPDAVLIWARGETALRLLKALRAQGLRVPVLSPESLGTPKVLAEGESLGDLIVAAPFDLGASSPALEEFSRRFRDKAGRPPGPTGICAYDSARLLLEAIDRAGLSRARIRDEISRSRFQGLLGEIRFSDLGGNPAEPVLLKIEKGRWTRAEAAPARR